MRKYKVAISFVLILAIVLPLFGCNTSQGATGPTTTQMNATHSTNGDDPGTMESQRATTPTQYPALPIYGLPTIPDSEFTYTVQNLPATVDNPDNLPVLKWLCLVDYLNGRGKQVYSEQAVQELNQMLAERDVSFRVQFVVVNTEAFYLNADWFSRPQILELLEDVDLIWGRMKPEDMETQLFPITEYVTGNAQPSLQNAVAHYANWQGTTFGGEIYGIQTYAAQPVCNGWWINPMLLTEYGLTVEDFEREYWEMDELFVKLYEKNGKKPFLRNTIGAGVKYSETGPGAVYPSVLSDTTEGTYQWIGACYAIDRNKQKPTVVNVMETERVKHIQKAVKRYIEAGYMTDEDYLISPGSVNVSQPHTVLGEMCIPTSSAAYVGGYTGQNVSGIAIDSNQKGEAIALLNLIAEDEAFRDQLFFGKENRDYTIRDGQYEMIEQTDGSGYNIKFLSMYSSFSSVMETVDDRYPSYEGKTKLESYLLDMEKVGFRDYPVPFDFAVFEQELGALNEIFSEFFHSFEKLGEEEYEEYLHKMKEAGSDKILAELQRQLDEWVAVNPGWNQ